jgi:hypothetical protein
MAYMKPPEAEPRIIWVYRPKSRPLHPPVILRSAAEPVILRSAAEPVILRSAATKNLWKASLEEKTEILRFAQDDRVSG